MAEWEADACCGSVCGGLLNGRSSVLLFKLPGLWS